MPEKCKHCGKPIVKFPLWEGEPFKSKFIWINFFKVDLFSLIFFISVMFLLFGFKVFTEDCKELIENPIETCEEKVGCDCSLVKEPQGISTYDDIFNPIVEYRTED